MTSPPPAVKGNWQSVKKFFSTLICSLPPLTKGRLGGVRFLRGSAIIVAMGVMTVLLILAAAIAEVTVKSLRVSKNVEQMNQAYFAAEAGIELALYDLTEHDAGYQKMKTTDCGTYLTNGTSCTWSITYRTTEKNPAIIPIQDLGNGQGDGNSPNPASNHQYDMIMKGDTYNLALYRDDSTGPTPDIKSPSDVAQFDLYIKPKSGSLSGTTEMITWELTGERTNTNDCYTTLIANDNSKITGAKIGNGANVLTYNTIGKAIKTDGSINENFSIKSFIQQYNDGTCNLRKPMLKLSGIGDLSSGIPYLEFKLSFKDKSTGTFPLPTSHATITSEGYSSGVKQTLTTKVKQGSTVPVFDYTLFQ